MMKACASCGATIPASLGARCAPCRKAKYRERERIRPPVTRRLYGSAAWHELARAVVAAADACHWCHTSAAVAKLTADHVVRVIDRPDLALEPDNVVAACRSCQERRKHRPDPRTWQPWERAPRLDTWR